MNPKPGGKIMEHRKFALPVAIVLTAHALVLFGIPSTPTHTDGKRLTTTTTGKAYEIPVKPYEPPPLLDPEANKEPVHSDNAGQPPPTQIDYPQIAHPGDFIVPVEPPRLQPKGSVDRIGDGLGFNPKGMDGVGPASPKLYSPDELDQPPRARLQISPDYPYSAKASGTTGTVEVEFIVDESGAVQSPHVVRSTHSAFDAPTLRAVAKWRFEPGLRLGRPVRFVMRVPVMFNLND
jgi:periplasmic protein TonB